MSLPAPCQEPQPLLIDIPSSPSNSASHTPSQPPRDDTSRITHGQRDKILSKVNFKDDNSPTLKRVPGTAWPADFDLVTQTGSESDESDTALSASENEEVGFLFLLIQYKVTNTTARILIQGVLSTRSIHKC